MFAFKTAFPAATHAPASIPAFRRGSSRHHRDTRIAAVDNCSYNCGWTRTPCLPFAITPTIATLRVFIQPRICEVITAFSITCSHSLRMLVSVGECSLRDEDDRSTLCSRSSTSVAGLRPTDEGPRFDFRFCGWWVGWCWRSFSSRTRAAERGEDESDTRWTRGSGGAAGMGGGDEWEMRHRRRVGQCGWTARPGRRLNARQRTA
jgi:hypothetical protein